MSPFVIRMGRTVDLPVKDCLLTHSVLCGAARLNLEIQVEDPRLQYFAAVLDSLAPKSGAGGPAASAICWCVSMRIRRRAYLFAAVAVRFGCQDQVAPEGPTPRADSSLTSTPGAL